MQHFSDGCRCPLQRYHYCRFHPRFRDPVLGGDPQDPGRHGASRSIHHSDRSSPATPFDVVTMAGSTTRAKAASVAANRSVADRPDDRCGTEPATDSIGTAVIGSTKRTSSSECSLSGLLSRSRIGRRTCVSRVFRFTTMRNRSHCHPTSKPSWQAESRRSHSRREPRMQEHTNSSPRPPKRAVNPASVAFCSRDRFPLSYLRA